MSPSKFVSKASASLASVGAAAIIVAGALVFVSWPSSDAAASDLPAQRLSVRTGAATKVTPVAVTQAKAVSRPKKATPTLKRTVKHRVVRRKAVHVRKPAVRRRPINWRMARASWYGPGFYGHTMAGGGRLQRNSMIVAHRSLPFGTKVEITYRGRTVTAVVRDRGPYVGGRQFDLGPGTAKSLRFAGVGTIRYRVLKRG